MNLLRFYLRRLVLILKNEVFVLPSRTLVLVFFLAMLLIPLVVKDPYLLRILILTSIFAIFAASWDLLSGFTGQINFGHALFFGVGAYGAAILNRQTGMPPWVTIPLGAVCAVMAGLVVGIPCLRLRGTYLALTTLAFPIILLGIIFAVPDLTGGELGISGLSRLAMSREANYYIVVITMLVLVTVMWKITDSKIGIIFHAIREDELAVKAAGINTTMYKLLAFSLSGFFAGISGGLYAHFMRIAGPSTLEVSMSFQVVIWSVFGGMVTIWGPVGAVFILFPMLELLRVMPEFRQLMFALVILLILLYMPGGLLPWLRAKIENECPRCKIRNIATRKSCRICAAEIH
ncbi:MAG: branched-chain amino acid ABC transporter permease [Desulfobacteraceae bacterium]|nr:MAG: branched-chain amino acid ABC transporter permease [Desulfobacteraceae bacterium]